MHISSSHTHTHTHTHTLMHARVLSNMDEIERQSLEKGRENSKKISQESH